MRKLFIAIFLVVCVSCQTPDGTAMLDATRSLQQEHDNMLNAFEAITERSADSDKKQVILTAIASSRASFRLITRDMIRLLQERTEVNPDEVSAFILQLAGKATPVE